MTHSKAVKRSPRSAGSDDSSVLETRAGRIYRDNLSKMTTSSLTQWSAKAAMGRSAESDRPR